MGRTRDESRVSLIVVFSIDFPCDEFNIVVEAEDAGDEQERLGDIDQQTVRHVIDHDDLIGHQRNAAHDEQHRTGILREFKSCVLDSVYILLLTSDILHQGLCTGTAKQSCANGGNDFQKTKFSNVIYTKVLCTKVGK